MRFLTSKTSFSAFIFSQAQIGPKNSEKINRTVFFTLILSSDLDSTAENFSRDMVS